MTVTWHREWAGFELHAVPAGSPDQGWHRIALCGKRTVLQETPREQPVAPRVCRRCEAAIQPKPVDVTQAGLFGEERGEE